MHRELIRFLLIGIVSAWTSSILTRGRIVRVRGCFSFLLFAMAGSLGAGYGCRALGTSDVISVVAAGAGAILALVFLQVLRNA